MSVINLILGFSRGSWTHLTPINDQHPYGRGRRIGRIGVIAYTTTEERDFHVFSCMLNFCCIYLN